MISASIAPIVSDGQVRIEQVEKAALLSVSWKVTRWGLYQVPTSEMGVYRQVPPLVEKQKIRRDPYPGPLHIEVVVDQYVDARWVHEAERER